MHTTPFPSQRTPVARTLPMVLLLLLQLLSSLCAATATVDAPPTPTSPPALEDASSTHIPDLVKRQQTSIVPTGLNVDTPMRYNGVPGTTIYYSLQVAPTSTSQPQQRNDYHEGLRKREGDQDEDEAINELDALEDTPVQRRQAGETIYISINTCQNPTFNRPDDAMAPPQMSLLISAVSPDQQLGSSLPNPTTVTLVEGYAMTAIAAPSSGAVVIGVAPPDADINKSDSSFVYDLAVSRDGPYHNVIDDVSLSLKLVDSDPSAALLITEDLAGWSANQTNQTFGSLDHGPPLNVFASNINFTGLNGLRDSYCALAESNQVVQGNAKADLNNGVEMGIVHAKPANDLEQQIYLANLNATSVYLGRLATLNASKYGLGNVVNGGGTLYPRMNFTTKTDPNCAVLFNLSFCADVNYAVPANPSRFNRAELSALYDNSTQDMYKNFSFSLQQVACNTTPTSQYSLAVDCNDCNAAYKTWLCAVSIPKCADFTEHYNQDANYGGVSDSGSPQFAENELPDGGDVQLGGPDDWSWVMPRNLAQAPLTLNGTAAAARPQLPPANSTQMRWLATNSSRNNATIAERIQPGPYLEIMPCEDLCYDLVRMCPASLQFGCPRPGSLLMRASYGQRAVAPGSGAYTCNAPGAVYFKNGAGRAAGGLTLWSALLVLSAMVVMSL